MPLDTILSQTGIKRKAIIAAPTICRFCNTKFLDKWFEGESRHKVRCTRCGLINAEVTVDDWMKSYYQGLRHSIGTYGELGFSIKGIGFKKAVKAAFGFKTDEEVNAKLKEFEYGIKMKKVQKKVEEERQKRRTKITIKHKGEQEYQLNQKSQ